MGVDIRYSALAKRALLKSNKRALIVQKIRQLAASPETLAANVKRLSGRPQSRLRVQDWRIIFEFDGDTLLIDDIAPRGSIYED
jgi:mRNA interferase RelE/StbE